MAMQSGSKEESESFRSVDEEREDEPSELPKRVELSKWFADNDMSTYEEARILDELVDSGVFSDRARLQKRDLGLIPKEAMKRFESSHNVTEIKFFDAWQKDFAGLLESEMRKQFNPLPAWAKKLCSLFPKLTVYREQNFERIQKCIPQATPAELERMKDLWLTEERREMMKKRDLEFADISSLSERGFNNLEQLRRMPEDVAKKMGERVQNARKPSGTDSQEQRERREAGLKAAQDDLRVLRERKVENVGNVSRSAMEGMVTGVEEKIQLPPLEFDKENSDQRLQKLAQHPVQGGRGREVVRLSDAEIIKHLAVVRGFSRDEQQRAALDLVELKDSNFILNGPTMQSQEGHEFKDTAEEVQHFLNTAKAEAWDASFSAEASTSLFGISGGVSAEGAKGERSAESKEESKCTLTTESHAIYRGACPQKSYSIGPDQLVLTQVASARLDGMATRQDAEDFTSAASFGREFYLQGELGGIFYSKSTMHTDSATSVKDMRSTHAKYMTGQAHMTSSGSFGKVSGSVAYGEEKATGEAERNAKKNSKRLDTFIVENQGPNEQTIELFKEALQADPTTWKRLQIRGQKYRTWEIVKKVSDRHELQVLLLQAHDTMMTSPPSGNSSTFHMWNFYVEAIEHLLEMSKVKSTEAKQVWQLKAMGKIHKLRTDWKKVEAIISTKQFQESLGAVELDDKASAILIDLRNTYLTDFLHSDLLSTLEPFMKQKQVFERQMLSKTLRTSEDFASEVERAIKMDPRERGQFVAQCYQDYKKHGLDQKVLARLNKERYGNPTEVRSEQDVRGLLAVIRRSMQTSEELIMGRMPKMWDEVDLPEVTAAGGRGRYHAGSLLRDIWFGTQREDARRFKDSPGDRLLDCITRGFPLVATNIFPKLMQDVAQGRGKGRGKGRIASHRDMPEPDIMKLVASLMQELPPALRMTLIERIHWQVMAPCFVGNEWFGGGVMTGSFVFTGVGHPQMVTEYPILVTATCKGKDTELQLVLKGMGLVLMDAQKGWENSVRGPDAWWEFGLGTVEGDDDEAGPGTVKGDDEEGSKRYRALTTVNMRGDIWKTAVKEERVAVLKDIFHRYLAAGAVVLIEVGSEKQFDELDKLGLFQTPQGTSGWFLVWISAGPPEEEEGDRHVVLFRTGEGTSASESVKDVLWKIHDMYAWLEKDDPPPPGAVEDVWKQHPLTGKQDLPVTDRMQRLLDNMGSPSSERAELQLQRHFSTWGTNKVKSMWQRASDDQVQVAEQTMKESELEQKKLLAAYAQKYQHRKQKGFHALPACLEAYLEALLHLAAGDGRMLQRLERHIKEEAARDKGILNCKHIYEQAKKDYEKCQAEDSREADEAGKLVLSAFNDLQGQILDMDHLQRELGQIYERTEDATFSQRQELPKLAARMLQNGFALEIMDGDAEQVPETWIRDTLREVVVVIGEHKKAGVACVIGKQSSGKTTLLKWLWGITGRTAIGQTTKGLHMYLVENTDTDNSVAGYDYLVVLDTRGLSPPELPDDRLNTEQDNRLVTFAMLMADVCLLTVSAEESQGLNGTLGIMMKTYYDLHENHVFQNSSAPDLLVVVKGISPHLIDEIDRQYNQFDDTLNKAVRQIEQDHEATSGKSVELNRSDLLKFRGGSDVILLPLLWNMKDNTAYSRLTREYPEKITDLHTRIREKLSKRHLRCIKDFGRLFGKMPGDDAVAQLDTLWCCLLAANMYTSFKDLQEAATEMKGNAIVSRQRRWLHEQREAIAKECEHNMREGERNSQKPKLDDLLRDVTEKLNEKHSEALQVAKEQIDADPGLRAAEQWPLRAKGVLEMVRQISVEATKTEVQNVYNALFELNVKKKALHAEIADEISGAIAGEIHSSSQRNAREAFKKWWDGTLQRARNREAIQSKEPAEQQAKETYEQEMMTRNLNRHGLNRHGMLGKHVPVTTKAGELSPSLRQCIRHLENPDWAPRTDSGGWYSSLGKLWKKTSSYPVITVKQLLDEDILPAVRDTCRSMQRNSGRQYTSWAQEVFISVDTHLAREWEGLHAETLCRSVIHLEAMDEVIKLVGEEQERWIEATSEVSILKRDRSTFWTTWMSIWTGTAAATTVGRIILKQLKKQMVLIAEDTLTTRASRNLSVHTPFVASDVSNLVAWRVIKRMPLFQKKWNEGQKEEARDIWDLMTNTRLAQKEAISNFLQETHLCQHERESAVTELIKELIAVVSSGAGHKPTGVGNKEAIIQFAESIAAVNQKLVSVLVVTSYKNLGDAKVSDVQKYLMGHLDALDKNTAYRNDIVTKMDRGRLIDDLVDRMHGSKDWPCKYCCPLCKAPCMKQYHDDVTCDKHETYHQPLGLTIWYREGCCGEHEYPTPEDCLHLKEQKGTIHFPGSSEAEPMEKYEEKFDTWSLKPGKQHPDLSLRRWMFWQKEVQEFLIWTLECKGGSQGDYGKGYDLHTIEDTFIQKLQLLYKTHKGKFDKDKAVRAKIVLPKARVWRHESDSDEPEDYEEDSDEVEEESAAEPKDAEVEIGKEERGAGKRDEPAANDSDRGRDGHKDRCEGAREHRKQHLDAEPPQAQPVHQGAAAENLEKVPMLGDGSCLFHSMAHGLSLLGFQENACSVRQQVADFMESHPDFQVAGDSLETWIMNDGASSTNTGSQMTVSDYVKTLRAEGSWGGEIEIRVCTHIFAVDIAVYTYKDTADSSFYNTGKYPTDKTSVGKVHLLFSRNHYDALQPAGMA